MPSCGCGLCIRHIMSDLWTGACKAVQANLFNPQIHYPTLMNGGELMDGILQGHEQNMSFWQNLFQYESNMLERQTGFYFENWFHCCFANACNKSSAIDNYHGGYNISQNTYLWTNIAKCLVGSKDRKGLRWWRDKWGSLWDSLAGYFQ